ncbi:MAG: sigma-70 family RNA polymerase sigma factor [candidate division WOR-3 bacterium]|nr:MAG: sigma-70 family RNA polymerase sigma factor [candidate division WOR-3 bacterium]
MYRIISDRRLRQYLEEISQFSILTKEEEFTFAKRFREKKDEEAKEKLIISNLRIVVFIAKKFRNQGLGLSELINAGNAGLMRAVDKFDERKGYRFNTYSVWWIKRAIYDAINAERGIVPKSFLAKRIQVITLKHIQKHGREPTVQELAKTLNTDASAVSLALTELIPPYSLDETFEDSDSQYIESLRLDIQGADNLISPPPDEIFKKKVQKEKLLSALSKLESREQEILKRNFGLGEYEVQSLEEISRLMNITRERVRQIKENALRKLKIILLSRRK